MARILNSDYYISKIPLWSIGADADNPEFIKQLNQILTWLNINIGSEHWNCYEHYGNYVFLFENKEDHAAFSLIWERYDI